ncbi:hypothetical protein HYT23_04410 [Candidatus Pacearchaeota archaeon]|nr:hypothetical protein [Candidatus Pacearchaeota archaeon]
MTDIFDNQILCKNCRKEMQNAKVSKNGFLLRAKICQRCGDKVIHPIDEQEYNKFIGLKKREFRVKMRLVGNSYAVSIPREIVNFIHEQEKMMDDMVRLCFEEAGKLSLNFQEPVKRKEFAHALTNKEKMINELKAQKVRRFEEEKQDE